ncbi:helix-turn-helix transcriptional regulator [Thermoactinospora rubra]|uniref:helix-turn-helix transcriptional regulator n=1 Tax=Thermoactinospora rubra TaxID=1088767 RepID=UPI000A10EE5F|nr:LuxR C-terminal-related transcriptional regulator [Thermoactinospora rubra]
MADISGGGLLPPELTSFVGRRPELHTLSGALASTRLVTLTGAGGCGKSRLALRLAHDRRELFAGDVWWVDLALEGDPASVPRRFADALGLLVTSEAAGFTATLAGQLADRRLLVVLDNCEHLAEAVVALVTDLLPRCPGMTVLATSRERLGIPGELVWRVPPLDDHDAVALFRDRGGLLPGTPETEAAVRAVCARLDGIPLALELAAAWTGTLSPQEILAELEDRFAVLVTADRAAPPRHRTLEASMDWSHALLGEADRVLFRRLGVFQPGFSLPAAERVCAFDGLDRAAVLTGLRGLIDKSLLVAETTRGLARYRMLETVRHYALARLAEAGELESVRERHAAACLETARESAPLRDGDVDAWRSRMTADYPNLRAALEWSLSRDDAGVGRALAAELAWLWHLEGRRGEGPALLRLAAERGAGERDALQARVLAGLALVADTTHPTEAGFEAARQARELALECGDRATAALAASLSAIGLFHDPQAAERLAATARAEAGGEGFVADAAQALLGMIRNQRDEHEEALRLLESALTGLLRRRDRGVASAALGFMALSNAHLGHLGRARDLAEQAVDVATPLADHHRVGMARSVLALVHGLRGEPAAAHEVLDPVVRLVDAAPAAPFVPGLALAAGRIHLWKGEPRPALRRLYGEAAWRGGPVSQEQLPPDVRLAVVAALRALGEVEAAERTCVSVLDMARAAGMPRVTADALEQLGHLTADPVRAAQLHREALGLRAAHGLRLGIVDSLDALAALGDGAAAARLAGACDRARQELGYPRREPPPGRDDLAEALAEGRRMTLEEAVAYATRARTTRRRPDSGWDSLTPTERQVVELVADGLTNPEIARRLFMSRSTVKTHQAHVYAKLGVANRTELAGLRRGG